MGKILATRMTHCMRKYFFLILLCSSGGALGVNRAFAPVTAPSVLAGQQVRFRHLLLTFTSCQRVLSLSTSVRAAYGCTILGRMLSLATQWQGSVLHIA